TVSSRRAVCARSPRSAARCQTTSRNPSPGGSARCTQRARSEDRRFALDALVLIDKLDELLQNAKGVPLSQDQVRVDREEILENLHTNLGKIMTALERGREQLAARSDERTSPATVDQDNGSL